MHWNPGEGWRRFALALCATIALTAGMWPHAALAGAPVEPGKKPGLPNVLLISLDTLRADHLSCYGYKRKTSPNIDLLAAEGVLFENLTAASSWTVPSHMSMFTGLYPSRHKVRQVFHVLSKGVPMLTERLKGLGFLTAAFVTGPSLNHRMGFDRGFRFYDDFTLTLMHENDLLNQNDMDKLGINEVPTNQTITRLASTWLRRNGKQRFFLFVHYWDIHNDYIPPAPFNKRYTKPYQGRENGRTVAKRRDVLERSLTTADTEHLKALYDGEIAHTDKHVGELMDVLKRLKVLDNTLIIITSDHGEAFMEHKRILHGTTLYEEMVHVPLILRLPGTIPKGKRIKGNVSHVDMMPTILGLLGQPAPKGIDGMDLTQAIKSTAAVPERTILSELNLKPRLRAARRGDYKVVRNLSDAGRVEFLRIVQGTDKRIDGQRAARALGKHLGKMLALTHPAPDSRSKAQAKTKLTPEEEALLRRLKTLGYGN